MNQVCTAMSKLKTGHFLKEWRQSMNMTQKEFADHIGLSMSNYNYLEAGKVGYTQKSLETIARALEVTPADLLSVNPLDPVGPEPDPDIWDEFYGRFQRLSYDHQQMLKDIVGVFAGYEQRKILARMSLTGKEQETS